MNQQTLKQILDELESVLPGRFLGKIFQLSPFSFAVDFGLRDGRFLFISIEPAEPRLYLIKRTARELSRASKPSAAFAQTVRSVLNGAKMTSLAKDENERVVRFHFSSGG